MAAPRKIRQNLIEANISELRSYGEIRMELIRNGQRGRPATTYYLNEEQALLICMFSKTENAALVRKPTPSDILRESEKRSLRYITLSSPLNRAPWPTRCGKEWPLHGPPQERFEMNTELTIATTPTPP